VTYPWEGGHSPSEGAGPYRFSLNTTARIRLLFVSESPVAPPNPPRSAVL